jgi:GNAT superfamily N-acetyltransferase
MAVEIREVVGRRELRTFIYLPQEIHAGHNTWVPPLWDDDRKYFDSSRNRAFTYSDTIMLLAWRDGRPVGRVMGIVNRRFNEHRGEKTARFGYLDTHEEFEVLDALLRAVEEWARGLGMRRIIGPYGFSDQDPEGFLIEGFEHRATIATLHNFPWMPEMIERAGYVKDNDYFVYKIEIPEELPEFYTRIYDRIMKRGQFRLLEFQKRSEIKPWIVPVLSLMNECYMASNIYGYSPLDEQEMYHLAQRYLPILDPRFVKVGLKDDQVVSFVIGIPDMTEGIQRAGGHLLPFGFVHVLRAARRTRQLDLLLGAIKEEHRGKGLDVMMGVAMLRSAREAGMDVIDTHHEMETNTSVRAEMERMGGIVYKKYRVWQRTL